jgi:hypothetical protein
MRAPIPTPKVIAIICCMLGASCQHGAEIWTLHSNDDAAQKMQYLDGDAVAVVAEKILQLPYPLARNEVLKRLGLEGPQLPSLTTNGRSLWRDSERVSSWSDQIGLTDFGTEGGRKARLLLWFESADSRTVIYAEILKPSDSGTFSTIRPATKTL